MKAARTTTSELAARKRSAPTSPRTRQRQAHEQHGQPGPPRAPGHLRGERGTPLPDEVRTEDRDQEPVGVVGVVPPVGDQLHENGPVEESQ